MNSYYKFYLHFADTGGESLDELLRILKGRASNNVLEPNRPLTEAELLNKPFYIVEGEDIAGVRPQQDDYRNALSDMLMQVRIASPPSLANITLYERLAQIDWSEAGQDFETANRFGLHNSLCLAHGRKPIMQYKETPYPQFEALTLQSQSDSCRPLTRKIVTPVGSLNIPGGDIAKNPFYSSSSVPITSIYILPLLSAAIVMI